LGPLLKEGGSCKQNNKVTKTKTKTKQQQKQKTTKNNNKITKYGYK